MPNRRKFATRTSDLTRERIMDIVFSLAKNDILDLVRADPRPNSIDLNGYSLADDVYDLIVEESKKYLIMRFNVTYKII